MLFFLKYEIVSNKQSCGSVKTSKTMQHSYDRLIICGKSGSGKDYLVDHLTSCNYDRNVSVTTRPPRTGEKDGIDYHFLSDKEYDEKEMAGEFFSSLTFNNWKYGTLLSEWRTKKVFIMTPSGINNLSKEERVSSYVIYLDISSEVRLCRLAKRQCADNVDRRMKADEMDFADFTNWDAVITNPQFNPKTIQSMINVILNGRNLSPLQWSNLTNGQYLPK